MKRAIHLTVSMAVLLSATAFGQPIAPSDQAIESKGQAAWPAVRIEHTDIVAWTCVFEDPTGQLLPETVLNQHFDTMSDKNWLKKVSEYAHTRIWLRFSVDNTAGIDTLRLVFFPGMHARIALYNLGNDSINLWAIGGLLVSKPRFAWQANTNCLPIETLPGCSSTYLVSISNFAILYDQVRAELFAPDAYWSYCQAYKEKQMPILLFLSFVIGGLIILVLFGLMQFFLTRDSAFLWYALFCLCNALNFARLLEMVSDVRWVTNFIPSFHGYTSLPASTFFYLLFVRYFLDLQLQNNSKGKLVKWATWFCGAVFIATIINSVIYFSSIEFSNQLAVLYTFFHSLLLIPGVLVLYIAFTLKGILPRFVAVGTMLLISAAAFALIRNSIYGAIPMHEQLLFENGACFLGVFILLESLCFALGLGYKTKLLEMQKRIAVQRQESDRFRISRDLHDEVGSTLSAISILSESGLTDTEGEVEKSRLTGIGKQARDALDSMSDIVWAINPENDSMERVVERMAAFSSTVIENAGMDLHFDIQKGIEALRLPMEKWHDFYLFFKEAVTNAARHSGAKTVFVSMKRENGNLILEVLDDGCGFDMEHTEEKKNIGGNGLRNLKTRANALGAELLIKSSPGNGCLIELRLPLLP